MAPILAGAVLASLLAQPEPAATREEFEGMMEAYVLSKLQDALDLTDERFGRMVVAQKKLQDLRREHRRERAGVLRELQRALERGSEQSEELERLLARLETIDRDFQEEQRERYGEIDALLDVRQRARYRILEVEIQRRLQELVRQVRQNRGRR